jgi:hypothetical protein
MTLAALRSRGYSEVDVAGHGRCLVVPADEFSESWMLDLAKNGHGCVRDQLSGQAVVFVKVGVDVALMRRSSCVKPAAFIEVQSHRVTDMSKEIKSEKRVGGWLSKWTPQEDEVLLAAAGDAKFAVNRLLKPVLDKGKLPGRSLEACLWRVAHLRKQAAKNKKSAASPAVQAEQSAPKDAAALLGVTASPVASEHEKPAPSQASNSLLLLVEKLQGDLAELRIEVAKAQTDSMARAIGEGFVSKVDFDERMGLFEKAIAYVADSVEDRVTVEELSEVSHALKHHKHAVGSGEALPSWE